MSNIGTAETSHVVIEAPEGLRYVAVGAHETRDDKRLGGFASEGASPGANNGNSDFQQSGSMEHFTKEGFGRACGHSSRQSQKSGGNQDKQKYGEAAFYIIDELLLTGNKADDAVEAYGSLNPRYATLKAVFPWRSDGNGRQVRQRNLPFDEGSRERRHRLVLTLVPTIGLRSAAQCVLIGASLFFYILCCAGKAVISDFDSTDMNVVVSGSFPVFASIIGLLLDQPTYMRKQVSVLPTRLTQICLMVDVLFAALVLVLFIIAKVSWSSLVYSPLFGLAALIALFLCAAMFAGYVAATSIWAWKIRRTRKIRTDRVFGIPVYGLENTVK